MAPIGAIGSEPSIRYVDRDPRAILFGFVAFVGLTTLIAGCACCKNRKKKKGAKDEKKSAKSLISKKTESPKPATSSVAAPTSQKDSKGRKSKMQQSKMNTSKVSGLNPPSLVKQSTMASKVGGISKIPHYFEMEMSAAPELPATTKTTTAAAVETIQPRYQTMTGVQTNFTTMDRTRTAMPATTTRGTELLTIKPTERASSERTDGSASDPILNSPYIKPYESIGVRTANPTTRTGIIPALLTDKSPSPPVKTARTANEAAYISMAPTLKTTDQGHYVSIAATVAPPLKSPSSKTVASVAPMPSKSPCTKKRPVKKSVTPTQGQSVKTTRPPPPPDTYARSRML